MLMEKAEISGPEENAELVKGPGSVSSSAVDPLRSDKSSGDQKQVLGYQSVTQLCHGLLRRWIDLKPNTKLRLRSHLRQHSKPSQENVVVIDLTDEENEAKGIVIDDVAGHELGDDLSKDNKGNFESTIQIVKEKNDVANALSANEGETGVERDESESVQRSRMKDVMVSKDLSKPIDAKNSIENGNNGTSKSLVEEKNVVPGHHLEADVEDLDLVQLFISKAAMTIDDIPEQESRNEDLSKNVDEEKSKTTLQSIEEQNIDTLHLPENKLESYVKEQSNVTYDSQSKDMIVNNDGSEQEIGKVNSSKHVKRGISKTVNELIVKKKDIFDKRQNKRKYQSKLHRSQPKNITVSDILRNKYGDAKSKSTVELSFRDKSNCILHLSDGVEAGRQGLVQHNHSKEMMVMNSVPEYSGDANSTKNDDHGKSKSATEFDMNKNIGTSRDDAEEGAEKTRNVLMQRSHTKDIVLIDDVPGQGIENFSKDDNDGTAKCVKSNEGKNTKNISKNHNFDRTLNEELDDICTITSSPKINIFRENQVNQDDLGLEVAERHADANSLGTELNIIGDHQVNDVLTPQSHILGKKYGDEDSSSPGVNILGDHQIDENIPSPESNILKELQEIDVSNILALVHFDSDDESATIDNTNTEIDGVESKSQKITFSKNVTKRYHNTAKLKKPNILQQDHTEHFEIIKVQRVTKTYENYNKKRKKRQSCESKSGTVVLHRNDTVYNENVSSKGTGNNDVTNMKNNSENVSEDIKNHMRKSQRIELSKLDDVHLFVDYNDSVNENDFIDTIEINKATNKRTLMDSNEIDDSVNRNSVDVNMIRRSSNSSAGAAQSNSDSEVKVVEGAFDVKLRMHPVVVLRRVADRICNELYAIKHLSRSSLRRSPTPSYDSPSDSSTTRYKSPSPLTTPRSSPYAPAPKSVLKKRAWRKLCKSREVLINEDKGERSRLTKRVELPDIEEVRRNNRNMLTAQVTPITQRQDVLVGAETCAHNKCTDMRNSTASVALPGSGRCWSAARRPAWPERGGDPTRRAAAKARSFITSIAKKRKYIATKQYVNYNSVKFGLKPRGRKRRRRGRPRLASVSPHASANLEDVQTRRELVTCANERDTPITRVTHFKSSPSNDAFSNLDDGKRSRDLITFEDEQNTTVTRVTVFRSSPSNDASSNLEENAQKVRENEQEITRNLNPIEVAIPAILAPVPSNDAPSVQNLGSLTRCLSGVQNKQEKKTLVKPTKYGEKSHRPTNTHVTRLITSPQNNAPVVLNEPVTSQDISMIQNEQEKVVSGKPVKIDVKQHHRKLKRRGRPRFTSTDVSSVFDEVQTRDLILRNKEETIRRFNHFMSFESVPSSAPPSVLHESEPMRGLATAQRTQDTTAHHRSLKRTIRVASVPINASCSLKESLSMRNSTTVKNVETTTRTNKSLEFAFTVPNESDFGNFTYGDLNEELTTTRNERNTVYGSKRVATSVMNERALRPDFSTAQKERRTKNSSDILNPFGLKETVLTTQYNIVKALDRRRNSADCRPQCVSVPLTEEQRQKKASKLGFKPILYRRGSSAPSSCVLNEGVPTGDLDTAHKQETVTDFSERRGSEVDYFGMVKDAGNWIDSGLAEDRTSSTMLSLTKENQANVSNVQPISELSSNICNPNVVADINEERVKLVDSPEPGHAADEFSPVIVNVQSLALAQLMNKRNLQTCAPISNVQPNKPTITLKRADRLSVYASHLTNTSDIGQVFMPDARKQYNPLSKLVDLVKRLPPASTSDQMKAKSVQDPGPAEKSLPNISLRKPTVFLSSRLNSSGEMHNFTTDSTMHPKETKQHLPKVITDKSLPGITLKRAKLVCISHPTNSSSEKQNFSPDSSVNLQEVTHWQEFIDVSDIRLPLHTNEQFSETTHNPEKPRLPVITLERAKTSCLNPSSDVLETGPMSSTQHWSPSSLPKITLKREIPVYASDQNSFCEMENQMSDSPTEKAPEETRLPRIVDVMGDVHVMLPDDRMGLHLVVTEELSPNRLVS